jgi:hypothetical protein
MVTLICKPGLCSHQVVKPASSTKSRRQVATKKKAKKKIKEWKKNEGLKKIATIENAKAHE